MEKLNCFVSVVTVLQNDNKIVETFLDETFTELEQNYSHYEIIIVDNGSTDETKDRITQILTKINHIRAIFLAREYDKNIAINAGLESVIGDYIVIMNANTDPPSYIKKMIDKAINNRGVVFGISQKTYRPSIFQHIGGYIFHWYCKNTIHLKFPKYSTDFRVISRKCLNALLKIKDSHRYLRLLDNYTGFEGEYLAYEQINRSGKKEVRSLKEDIRLAKNILVSHSIHPLRFVTFIGLTASVINLIYLAYVIVIYSTKNDVAEGWTTLSLQAGGMFFMIFLILTILSEYIGKILAEIKNTPQYNIMDEKTSSVLVNHRDHRNVTDRAIDEITSTEPIKVSK